MPPKLRVLEQNQRFEQRLKSDISSSLAQVLKTNPKITPKEALWSIEKKLLENNPYHPPKDGKCPINDLPDEILASIFTLGVDIQLEEWEEGEEDDEDDWVDDDDSDEEDGDEDVEVVDEGADSDDSMSSSAIDSILASDYDDELADLPFQILVSHVCERWRSVSLDAHHLWKMISFFKRLRLEKVQAYIARANGLPLDIVIDCNIDDDVLEELDPEHPDFEQTNKFLHEGAGEEFLAEANDPERYRFLSLKDLETVLDTLQPEVSHWGTFVFRGSTYHHVRTLLSRLHNMSAASTLESFQLYIYEDCEDYDTFPGDDSTPYLPFQGQAPKLKEAVFWGIHIHWDGALPNFLCDLEEFELSYLTKDVRPSYTTFAQIINNSPDLRSLVLSLAGPALADGVAFDSEDGWGPTPLVIPSVKELALHYQEADYASALIQHLDFPNLTHLSLNFEDEDYTSFVQILSKPVQGKSESLLRQLSHLKVSGLPCNVAGLEALLSQLTLLKTLNLRLFGEEETTFFDKLSDPAAGRSDPPPVHEVLVMPPDPTSLPPADQLPKVFCPQLENITLSDVNGTQLRELILARRKLGVPLKKVVMSQNDHLSEKDEKWIRKNVDDLQFFEPSDSDESVIMQDDDEMWVIGEEGEEVVADDDGEDEDPDDDSGVDEPFPTPLAQELGRGGRRRRHGGDLD